jgi:hypothetical protein
VAKKKKDEKPKEYTRRQLSHFKQQQRRQRITLIAGVSVIAAVILIIAAGWFMAEYYPLHRTMLEINGVKFNVAYYIDIIKLGRINQPDSDVQTLASDAMQVMMQGEIIRQGAEKLGVTVSQDEIDSYLKALGLPANKSNRGYFGNQLLINKLQDSYFGSKVPTQAKQINAQFMMLESDQQAREIRGQLVSGGNFTALAGEYALNYYSKNVNSGDFGWHIREVLKTQLGTEIPLDYAFSAQAGSLSQPLSDNASFKHLGYWLINVADRPEEFKVNVKALFVSDNETAKDIRTRLESGRASLTDMADQYTQYSISKELHGDLGVIDESENTTFTQAFNDYTFNPKTPVGVWSQPILDTELETAGGSWLVKMIGVEEDKQVSDEDRNALISQAFNDWFSGLASDPELQENGNLLDDNTYLWVIDRVNKELSSVQTGQ